MVAKGTDDEITEGCSVDGSTAGMKDGFPSVSVRIVTTACEINEPLFHAVIPSKEQNSKTTEYLSSRVRHGSVYMHDQQSSEELA